jgi:pyrroloquinoline-quinone synthase
MTAGLWDRETFVEKLREIGARAYHDKHPFHVAMNEGRLSSEAVRSWVANRFYYQRNIPRKDAAILSNCPLPEVRRIWIHRIADHDGTEKSEGGIEAWLQLGEACGLSRDEVIHDKNLQPGVRFAVDAYVNFARNRPWPIAIASSLTELFAPDLMAARLAAFERFYPWIDARGLDYFRRRVTQARRDSDEALAITLEHCNTLELQREALGALQFKCDILWSMLDVIDHAYDDIKEEQFPNRPAAQNLGRQKAAGRFNAHNYDS